MLRFAVVFLFLYLAVEGAQVLAKEKKDKIEPDAAKKAVGSFQTGCPTSTTSAPLPPAKSCLDHLKRGSTECGYYKIYDNNGDGYTVYCDMNNEPGSAWTLVLSSTSTYRNMAQFKSTAFTVDAPVNENSPNWKLYRSSLVRMTSLKDVSTHWRATCSYPTYGIDYKDYLRGKFADFNIMKYIGSGTCQKVELVNIRGHICAKCTAKFWQVARSYLLHIDSTSAGCGLDARQGAVSSEDDFGYYGNTNKNFRCTADADSSTQWWFGGYM